MFRYRPAGREFIFPCPVLELEPFGPEFQTETDVTPLVRVASNPFRAVPTLLSLLAQTEGLVGGSNRRVETWSAPGGLILKTAASSDFFISADGSTIENVGGEIPWPKLEREVLVGPALVLALALQNIWCLHASAVTMDGRVMLFLGESGEGKSTLAQFLASRSGFSLAADDILPVTLVPNSMSAWPRFPQLKLPLDTQPGVNLPECLPVDWICVLGESVSPQLLRFSTAQGAQLLLRHTAGTRLFPPELLSRHLEFCARASANVSLFQLSYPRRLEALPDVMQILRSQC